MLGKAVAFLPVKPITSICKVVVPYCQDDRSSLNAMAGTLSNDSMIFKKNF